MAIYRSVQMTFWTDAKVVDNFTPEDRYFYLYLLTNPHTNLCGCYEISNKQMSDETGYTKEVIERLVDRMEKIHDVIRFSKDTKEVLILNWSKFNWTSSEKFRKPLEKEIGSVKNPDFKRFLEDMFSGTDTVSIPYPYGSDTTVTVTVSNTVSDSNTNSISKSNKSKSSNNPDIEIIDKEDIKIETLCEKRFKQFWELYPRKEGKGAAKKSWEKINPNAELFEKIMSAVRENIEHNPQWQRNNGQYIPHPTTWLNQGRWDDDISSLEHDDYFTRELKKMGGLTFE